MRPSNEYHDALAYLYSFTDYEKKGFAVYAPEFYNLDRMRHLLALLDDPQQAFQAIHIAGTKGKGSTAAMIESVLRTAGHHTGLYTSPHLHTFRERIQASGQLIPESDIVHLVDQMKPLVSQVADITTFEIMTGLAFLWFAQQGVEWAMLEVGLGGRLDATNVVMPAVAVITSISLDHTTILGDTLTKIAAEKAGIIKPGVPIVSAPQSDEALSVIRATCAQKEAPLTLVGQDWTWESGQGNLHSLSGTPGQAFTIQHYQGNSISLWIPLLGSHQLENATTSVAALYLLREKGVMVPPEAIRDGLRDVRWPGRLEILGSAPWVIADSAHNGDSAQKLIDALNDVFTYKRLILILGASADHATPELLHALLSGADRALATQAQHPRAAEPPWLQTQGQKLGYHLEVTRGVPEALDLALAGAGPEDLICGTGSVFVAAELRKAWFQRQGEPIPQGDPT